MSRFPLGFLLKIFVFITRSLPETVDLGTQVVSATSPYAGTTFSLSGVSDRNIVALYGQATFDSSHYGHAMQIIGSSGQLEYGITQAQYFSPSVQVNGDTISFGVYTGGTVYVGAQITLHMIVNVV